MQPHYNNFSKCPQLHLLEMETTYDKSLKFSASLKWCPDGLAFPPAAQTAGGHPRPDLLPRHQPIRIL